MPPKKRGGRKRKQPVGLHKAQQAKRDAKAAAEAKEAASESKIETEIQTRPAMPVHLQNQETMYENFLPTEGGAFLCGGTASSSCLVQFSGLRRSS